MFNQKELGLLKDLTSEEKLCVQKYEKYAQKASNQKLEEMLDKIKMQEQTHEQTLASIAGGAIPSAPQNSQGASALKPKAQKADYSGDKDGYENDKYLCSDALATEKHVSSMYNTCIFEFKDINVRNALNHIQKEEQGHGELLYSYMSQNGMYN